MIRHYQKEAIQLLSNIGSISLEIGFGKNKPSPVINEDFIKCDCCGETTSPHNINEACEDFWFCGKCFSEWEATDAN